MISQRLSLNMPRLNQNQRIQTLTMLARGDNISNVSRAFRCHRNTIIWLCQCFQQTGGVADHCRPGRPRVTNPQMNRFITLTSFSNVDKFCKAIRYQQADSVAPPGNPFSQGGPMWDKCLQHIIWLPVCSGHNSISFWGRQQWAQVLFSDSLGLTLVIMMVEFKFLEEKGNILLIIVSLRGTDLEVGCYRVA